MGKYIDAEKIRQHPKFQSMCMCSFTPPYYKEGANMILSIIDEMPNCDVKTDNKKEVENENMDAWMKLAIKAICRDVEATIRGLKCTANNFDVEPYWVFEIFQKEFKKQIGEEK